MTLGSWVPGRIRWGFPGGQVQYQVCTHQRYPGLPGSYAGRLAGRLVLRVVPQGRLAYHCLVGNTGIHTSFAPFLDTTNLALFRGQAF